MARPDAPTPGFLGATERFHEKAGFTGPDHCWANIRANAIPSEAAWGEKAERTSYNTLT